MIYIEKYPEEFKCTQWSRPFDHVEVISIRDKFYLKKGMLRQRVYPGSWIVESLDKNGQVKVYTDEVFKKKFKRMKLKPRHSNEKASN